MIFKLLVGAAAARQFSPPLTRRDPGTTAKPPTVERREPTELCPAATQLERTRRWRGGGENLWQSYSRTLEARPVVGNMITGGLLAFTGDFVMQAAEKNPVYDHLRALRFVGFRVCVVRCYTVWVRELEHWVNRHVDGDRRRLLTKTFFWTWPFGSLSKISCTLSGWRCSRAWAWPRAYDGVLPCSRGRAPCPGSSGPRRSCSRSARCLPTSASSG